MKKVTVKTDGENGKEFDVLKHFYEAYRNHKCQDPSTPEKLALMLAEEIDCLAPSAYIILDFNKIESMSVSIEEISTLETLASKKGLISPSSFFRGRPVGSIRTVSNTDCDFFQHIEQCSFKYFYRYLSCQPVDFILKDQVSYDDICARYKFEDFVCEISYVKSSSAISYHIYY